MSDGFTPRAGSLAEKLLAHWATSPAPLNSRQIADLFGVTRANVRNTLKGAIEAGAIVVDESSSPLVFSLPDSSAPTQPSDGKLEIGIWSDGDVVVRGGQINQDDSVTYTREQLVQLIRFVTSPSIGMPVASEIVPAALPLAGM